MAEGDGLRVGRATALAVDVPGVVVSGVVAAGFHGKAAHQRRGLYDVRLERDAQRSLERDWKRLFEIETGQLVTEERRSLYEKRCPADEIGRLLDVGSIWIPSRKLREKTLAHLTELESHAGNSETLAAIHAVRKMVQEGKWRWSGEPGFNLAHVMQIVARIPGLLSHVTRTPLSVWPRHADTSEEVLVGKQRWVDVLGSAAVLRENAASKLAREYERLIPMSEMRASRYFWAGNAGGVVAALFAADLGTRLLCGGRSLFQITYEDHTCR